MIRNIALALAVAAVSTSATAQTNKQTWQDLLKPYEAKTTPGDPNAKPLTPVEIVPPKPNTSLLDGCVISAIGRLPKADGLRVTKSSYEFRESGQVYQYQHEFWTVSISVDLQGRQASYHWLCRIDDGKSAVLLRMP